MITLHLILDPRKLLFHAVSLRLTVARQNFYIVWQNEWDISFFIQTGVRKYNSSSLWVLVISPKGSQLPGNIF